LKPKLSKSMSLTEFDNGYWYATELKRFGVELGIPSASKLRKDELEEAIKLFLKTGKRKQPPQRKLSPEGVRDVERGLKLDLPVIVYTNDKETKTFLEREAKRMSPAHKRKSGSRYRINRWREDQLARGVKITYGDLIAEYVRLNQTDGPFEKIPQVRYINFMSEFLSNEKSATREDAIKAWKKVKQLDAPKTYQSWLKHRRERS
jgi:hypothetical protein